MAGWGLQGTCQHILPHEPYVLCHNCQKRFGAVRMVCGCGLARSIRRQERVSFNCTDMPRIKGKNTGRLSSPVPVTLPWKEMFVYNKRTNLWMTKPNWQLQVMCKNQFESLLHYVFKLQLQTKSPRADSQPTQCLASLIFEGRPRFGTSWFLQRTARCSQEVVSQWGSELDCPSFLVWLFPCLHVSGTIHTSVWKPWPILGYTSS